MTGFLMPAIDQSRSTSSSLLRRACRFDPAAWQRLTQIYGPLVYRWCRQAGLQDSDAADLVQESFNALAGCIDQFQMGTGRSFRGWLWGITRHKLTDYYRQRQRDPQATGGTDARIQLEQLPERSWEEAVAEDPFDVQGSLVHRALSVIQTDFAETTWKAFWRVTIDGANPADVADELHMSLAAVYKAKSRVLAHLRNELDGVLN